MSVNLKRLQSEEIKNMSFEDIFLSPEYKNDLIGIMRSACLRVGFKKHITLSLQNNPDSGDIAYTDGSNIYVNLGAKFAVRLRKKPVLFHMYIVGLIAHELGHIFWTEFDDGERYMQAITKGEIYPTLPKHKNSKKFEAALKNKSNRYIFSEMCHSIDNILEDIYVNALQAEMLGGLYSKGIELGNIMITEEMSSISEQKANGYYDFNIIMNCLLTKLKSGTVVYGHYDDEYTAVVDKIFDIAKIYIFKSTHKERVEGINYIICELWKYIEAMLKDVKEKASENQQGNQQQQSGSGSNDGSGGSSNNESESSDGSDSSDNSGSNGSGSSATDSGDSDDSNDSSETSGNSGDSKDDKTDSTESNEDSNGSGESGESKDDSNESKSASNNSGESDDSSDGSDKTVNEEKLKELIGKAIEQLQGQTQESKNQQTSPIAGKNDIQPQSAALDSALAEEYNKSEQPRFPVSTGEAIAAQGNCLTERKDYIPPEAINGLAELVDNLVDKRLEESNNEAVNNELVKDVEDIDFGPIHANIDKTIYRVSGNRPEAKREYNLMLKKVAPVVGKLEKVILRTIKEENFAGERRGRYYGKKLDTSRLYRPDARVFKDKKNPEKVIDCAFYILVDVSGSMYGTKITMARLVSILFAEVCEKLNIPLEITGHTTEMCKASMVLYNFINYSSINKNEKYSLAYMNAENSNRDGAAIIYGCERLLKRPEEKKVFCIISDGQPANYGYSGETAKADMKHIKNTYTKKGITFVAAAIDSDKDYIKAIYGKNFLGISNLEIMPQTFGKILQKSVLD